ncbi:MAG: hypothetical protein M3R70_05555 [Actinomycetota bacterium]|nr:hypothetical protein [Actinomycetota bacterium]
MNKQQQLIVTVAAVVLAAVIASVVTWLAVKGDNNKGGGRAAAIGAPPPGATGAKDKQAASSQKPAAGAEAPHVGAPSARRECDQDGPPTVFAEWRNTPDTLDEVKTKAKEIVYGTVVGVQAGPDQVIAVKGEPGGVVRTPTRVVTMRVANSYKGPASAGDTVTVTQLGDACYRVANDPRYRVGQSELLMLQPGPRNALQIVSPEGRYRRSPQGTLAPVIDNPATRSLKNRRVAAVARRLRR